MKNFLILSLTLLNFLLKAQSLNINELHSHDNVRKFGDFLFCEHDYLRAIGEYERLLSNSSNDTLEFKIFLAYSNMGKYNLAREKYSQIKSDNVFTDYLDYEYYKILFRIEQYKVVQEILSDYKKPEKKRLHYLSYLFTGTELPEKNSFAKTFPAEEQNSIIEFYDRKANPSYRSPVLAGIFSTLIPGSGKIYTGEIGDGVVAFIASSLFAFLSYDNFKANHNFRGWLFAGIGLFFYAGNIYGSAASAQIYNARVDHQLKHDLIHYLETKNYFLPYYEFCE